MPTITTNDTLTSTTPSVADLLVGIRDRDSAAWDAVIRRYGELVFATVRSFRL